MRTKTSFVPIGALVCSRSVLALGLLCHGVAFAANGQTKGAEAIFMNQRATFSLQGSACDEAGKPISNVTVVATVYRYNASKLDSEEAQQEIHCSGAFTLLVTNATTVIVEGRKEGYSSKRLVFKYTDLVAAKRQQLMREIAAGKLAPDALSKNPYAPYSDLTGRYTDVKVLLTRQEGPVFSRVDKHFTLSTDRKRLRDSCEFAIAPATKTRAVLSLVMAKPGKDVGAKNLGCFLETSEGAGLVLHIPPKKTAEILRVPSSGYRQKVAIALEGQSTLVSFCLRTKNGDYVKAFGLLEADTRKQRLRLELLEVAIASGGTRTSKVTDD